MAAALKTPSVILFSVSDPDRWQPLNHELHWAVLNSNQASPEGCYQPRPPKHCCAKGKQVCQPFQLIRSTKSSAVRLDNIGDVVMTGPALRALRQAYPTRASP